MSNVKIKTAPLSTLGVVGTNYAELDYSSFGASNTISTLIPDALMCEVLGGVIASTLQGLPRFTDTEQGPSEQWDAYVVDVISNDIIKGIEGYENAFKNTGLDQRGLSAIFAVTGNLKEMVGNTAASLPIHSVRKLNSRFEQTGNLLLALIKQLSYSIRFVKNDFAEKDDAQFNSDYNGEIEIIHDGNTWLFAVNYTNAVRSTVFYVDGHREPKVSKSAEAIGILFQTAAHLMVDREYEARRNRALGRNTQHVNQAKQIAKMINGDYRDYMITAKSANNMLAQVPTMALNPVFAGREANLAKDGVQMVVGKQISVGDDMKENISNIFITNQANTL